MVHHHRLDRHLPEEGEEERGEGREGGEGGRGGREGMEEEGGGGMHKIVI